MMDWRVDSSLKESSLVRVLLFQKKKRFKADPNTLSISELEFVHYKPVF